MSPHAFEVTPVRHYDGARYPSPHAPVTPRGPRPVGDAGAEADVDAGSPDGGPGRRRVGLARLAATLVLVLGLALGLVACFPERHPDDPPPDARTTSGDGGPDDEPDAGPVCAAGAVVCLDETTVATCDAGAWQARDCDEVCVEQLGVGGRAIGCDASQPQPCECDYDIIDGDIAACTPGDVTCFDAGTMATCEGYDWVPRPCAEVCLELLGPGAIAIGCDAAEAVPCQCDYDILDGGIGVECTPGELACQSADTASICSDSATWQYIGCAAHCTTTYGPGYLSAGCDATSPDDFCGCYEP